MEHCWGKGVWGGGQMCPQSWHPGEIVGHAENEEHQLCTSD